MDNIHPYSHKGEPVRHIIPDQRNALIVVCPHAGIYTPKVFKDTIDVPLQDVLARGDRYTDWISEHAPDHGAQFIYSTVTPAYLNVGRSIDSIHPDDVRGGLKGLACNIDDIYVNERQGQGLVAMKTLYGGHAIYKSGMEPNSTEIQKRIDNYYTPFHSAVRDAVQSNIEEFGLSLLFDVHTCPDIGAFKDPDQGNQRADIIISDRFGTTCDARFMDALEKVGNHHGFSVKRNDPYTGGYNTRNYGADGIYAGQGAQSLQIEWNRKTLGIDQRSFDIVDQDKFSAVSACHDEMVQTLTAELS